MRLWLSRCQESDMPAQQAFAILVSLLLALFPLAVYCLLLSSINRRAEPLLVRGVWDFGGVLFAGSGFALWAVPMMLTSLYERSLAGGGPSFDEIWWQWWLIWSGYYGLMLAGGVFLLWLRRHTTAIYNVAVDAVPTVVAAALQRLGLDFAQNVAQQFLIAPSKSPAQDPQQDPAPYSAALEV